MNNEHQKAYPQNNTALTSAPEYGGMTKFERVAMAAMQGFASSADEGYGTPQEVAKDGIAAAHAFFNELEETQ